MRYDYDGSVTQLREIYARYRGWELLVDSRRLGNPDRTLFFALPGARTHGEQFIPELYARGVRHFVARSQVPGEDQENGTTTYVITGDPLRLLQDLAAHHRQQFDLPVIGITGSNGKTIVKDWLVELLRTKYRVCASPRSYNSQIGVPLSVWQLDPEHEIAVFEAGVSRSGEMERLRDIIRPTAGVFTLLGSAHAAGFPSEAAKHREKIGLFAGADWVVVPADDNASICLLRQLDVEVITHLPFSGRYVEVEERTYAFPFAPLPAIYLDNASAAVATALTLGVDETTIARVVPHLRPLDNRLELREGLHGGPVINDSYSNDTVALAAALEFAERQQTAGLTLILGTLQQTPGTDTHAELSRLLTGRVNRLLCVGKEYLNWTKLPPGSKRYARTQDLLADLPNLTFGQDTILVKGASHQRLDRVADVLSRKQHRTVLRVDLTALTQNFSTYRRVAGTGMIVMVKAAAYGGGLLPVTRALAAAGADYLAVAYPDEGRELRRGQLNLPILVLNAEPSTYAYCEEHRLEPVVHDLAGLRAAWAYALRLHLELDTGMGRLGFTADQLPALVTELADDRYGQRVATVFTHLVASEAAEHDAFTRAQMTDFGKVFAQLRTALGYAPARHVLNTNGISRFPDQAFEYVRLGIGLYGIGDATLADRLRPVLRFTTRVSRVFDREADTTVGYNRRGRLLRPSRIAVLSIGYADGLPRLAGEGRFSVLIHGREAPVVGAVCMDMTMVDVTGIESVQSGDEVIIFGPEHPIELLASAAETIPYEVLTGIGP
ncbi:MAG: alanine racemase, partial [Bacteroidota bacterium]